MKKKDVIQNKRAGIKWFDHVALHVGLEKILEETVKLYLEHPNTWEVRPQPSPSMTTVDYYGLGPFYKPNAPTILNGKLATDSEPGTRLYMSGIVKTPSGIPVPNTTLDVWHATDAGDYDHVGYNLRGVTRTDEAGFYYIETIMPGKYLNGASYRPRHIHFKVSAPGRPPLVTQLYFQGDTDIPGDAAASLTGGNYDARKRIVEVINGECTWDITVDENTTIGWPTVHWAFNNAVGELYKHTPKFRNNGQMSFNLDEVLTQEQIEKLKQDCGLTASYRDSWPRD